MSRLHKVERGMSSSAEVVVVLPALIILLAVIVSGGKYWYAKITVEDAATSAARSATLSRSATDARANAEQVATSELQSAGVTCESRSVKVDTSGFQAGVGQHAEVSVTVDCRISFGDLIVPGWPGATTVSHTATSVLDVYRERHR